MRIALAQINPVVGDVAASAAAIGRALAAASQRDVDLVMFPPSALTGALPGDFAQTSTIVDECARSIDDLAKLCRGITAIIGYPVRSDSPGLSLRNAVAICAGGKFAQWNAQPTPTLIHGARVGIVISETRRPENEPPSSSAGMSNAVAELAAQGAELLVILGRCDAWERDAAGPRHPASALAKRHAVPVLHCEQADASGEACSRAFDKRGEPIVMTVAAEGSLLLMELPELGFVTDGRPGTCGGVNWGPAGESSTRR